MPGVKDYLRGFGITKGMTIGNYKLIDIHIQHAVIELYKEYQYPIELVFSYNSAEHNCKALLTELQKHVSGERVINSRYGNPYRCNFGIMQAQCERQDATLTLRTVGHSYRIYHS